MYHDAAQRGILRRRREPTVKTIAKLSILVGLVFSGLSFIGCGPEKTIELRYQRLAEYEISPKIRRVGIAEFGGQTAQDRQWGQSS